MYVCTVQMDEKPQICIVCGFHVAVEDGYCEECLRVGVFCHRCGDMFGWTCGDCGHFICPCKLHYLRCYRCDCNGRREVRRCYNSDYICKPCRRWMRRRERKEKKKEKKGEKEEKEKKEKRNNA